MYFAPMTQRDAIALIDHPILRAAPPTHWADLGCGSGTFTLALATLLPPGSTIEAIDLRPGVIGQRHQPV
jgi:ubiquinone/menaquinone biosynthesis C-methylase UbiE